MGAKNVTVSFVIPVYNSESTIKACVESVLSQKISKEVIVVDDGSTDSTHSVLKGFGKDIVLIRQANKGAASARNKGLGAASGNYVAFIDADVELPSGWALKAMGMLEGTMTAGAGGPGIGGDKGAVSRSLDALLFGRTADAQRDVSSLATMNVMYRRAVVRDMRFDESFRGAAGEDPDFNFRLVKRGYRLVFSPELRVTHRHPTSLREVMRKWYGYGKETPLLYSKHPEMRGRSYWAGVSFFPAFIAFSALSLLYPPLAAVPCLQVLALFLFYVAKALGIKGRPNVLSFSVVHTLKQLAQLFGFMAGLKKARGQAPGS